MDNKNRPAANGIGVRKPADRTLRPRRLAPRRLKRVLGVPAVFSAGYGNVGSSIYYALGIVALVAMGATPVALGIAGVIFILTSLTYAEGTSMIPEAGGSASFAREGFNNATGFIAAWALFLSYIVTIAISAYTIPPYLGFFWPILKESAYAGTLAAMGIVLFLMTINIIGIKETSFINIGAAVLDIITQLALIVIAFVLAFDPVKLIRNIIDNWPTTDNLILGIAMASIAFTGIETISQMAEETRLAEKRVPRALVTMIVTVLVMFAGISLVSLSVMTPQELASEWNRDPLAGIAANIPSLLIQEVLRPLIALLAGTILFIATNAGLIGISRLSFSLSQHNLVPKLLGRVHPRFHTPYVSIIIFSSFALLILATGFEGGQAFTEMGTLYIFGSLLSFIIAHASVIALRIRQPDRPRPFRLGWNIRIGRYHLPATALLGITATSVIWVIIQINQPFSRWVGLAWMSGGILIYFLFRRLEKRRQSK